MTRISRRTFLSGLAAGAAGVAVAACVPQPVMPGGCFRTRRADLVSGNDRFRRRAAFWPHGCRVWGRNWSASVRHALQALPDGTVAPYLVSSYEINDDATLYTLHIDPRAVWSDGSPVTASQIKAAWSGRLIPANAWVRRGARQYFP